ncbi:MAG: phosphotransferase [Candidatus Limnocylindrales bacterium]
MPLNMPRSGVATWTDPRWREVHLGWAEARLKVLGRSRVGKVEQRAVPWSTVIKIPTDGGVAWSKANGPGSAHEGPLLVFFEGLGETAALLPLAVAPGQPWLLLDDGGQTLRSRLAPDGRNGDSDMDAWTRILPIYAALQRRAEGNVPALLAAGVPDLRPARTAETLRGLIDDDALWARVDADERDATDLARQRLRELFPLVADLAAELAASPIPPTIEHGDLHGNNILLGPEGAPTFFDWGDSAVAHPFVTMIGTFSSIAHHAGLDIYGSSELDRLRDTYTEAWTDLLPRTALARVVTLAMDLGHIGKAATWERAMTGLSPDQMGGYHGWPALWLTDLVPRLELTRA